MPTTISYRTPLTLTCTLSSDFIGGATVVALYRSIDGAGLERYRCCLPYADVNVIPMQYGDGYNIDEVAFKKRAWIYPEHLSVPPAPLCACDNEDPNMIHKTLDGITECVICGMISVHGRRIPNEIKCSSASPRLRPSFVGAGEWAFISSASTPCAEF